MKDISSKIPSVIKNNEKNVLFLIKILLIIKIFLIKHLNNEIIMLYKTLTMRIIVALLVAIMAYVDPVLALLMVIVYIIGLQEASNRAVFEKKELDELSINNNAVVMNNNNAVVMDNNNAVMNNNNAVVMDNNNAVMNNNNAVMNNNNNVVMNNNNNVVMDNNNAVMNNNVNDSENNYNEDILNPADLTLSDNIQLEESKLDLNMIQNNVTGVDPDSPMMSFQMTNDAQGLNFVKGFDNKSGTMSKF